MYVLNVFWPSNYSYFCQDNLFPILNVLKIPLSEAVKAPIAAKEELFDVEKDVIDDHLQVHDEGVAFLFDENCKELLVEVIKEEPKVRATVPSATTSDEQVMNK